MNKLIVLSGVSGSGKSTYAKQLIRESLTGKACIASADDYFMKACAECCGYGWHRVNGVEREDCHVCKATGRIYRFDPAELSLAHGACFRKVIEVMSGEYSDHVIDIVVVDNTNTTVAEIAPYMLAASAYGYEAEIVTLDGTIGGDSTRYLCQCAERNKHGVSVTTIDQQYKRIRERRLLPWWRDRIVNPAYMLGTWEGKNT